MNLEGTCRPNCNHSLRPLTGEVVRGGGHSAPLEEGVCVGVHYQQTSHIPADFNGSHYFWVHLPFHWHAIHLRRKQTLGFYPHRKSYKSCYCFLFLFFLCLVLISHRTLFYHSQDFFLNIITLSARGSRAGNPVYPHTNAHTFLRTLTYKTIRACCPQNYVFCLICQLNQLCSIVFTC